MSEQNDTDLVMAAGGSSGLPAARVGPDGYLDTGQSARPVCGAPSLSGLALCSREPHGRVGHVWRLPDYEPEEPDSERLHG